MASTAPLNGPPNLVIGRCSQNTTWREILRRCEMKPCPGITCIRRGGGSGLGRRDRTLSLRLFSLRNNDLDAGPAQACAVKVVVHEKLKNETASSEVVGKNDLLIVGPGVLGRLVAQIWREENPGCQIYGQTLTTDHHDELVELGIVPSLKGQNLPHRFPYVIFCAPPTRSSDYAADLREAALSWNGEGCFVFTSSSAPYDCADNGYCDEDTPVVSLGRSPRIDALLKAENVVLEHGGCVLRLVGLYKADRGPHSYWLNQGTSELRPDHILNLIHYEDAASLAMSILRKNLRGRVFLGCDNHPLSRQEIMDQVNKSGKFNKKFEAFTGVDGVLGKRLNNSKTRNELQWEAKYASFSQFLEEM